MKNKKGGKVFASGGFGCVFDPALRCEGSQKNDSTHSISKLMTEKNALQEYNEIQTLSKKLETVKNYKDYFLLYDISVCKPYKLTETDLKDFNTKCKALPKDNITKVNINDSLDKLLMLNMPNGGVAIDEYIYENGSIDNLIKLNSSLMELLINGIIPMNKRNVYHCDIKDSNILFDKTNDKARLIDWGLSTEYVPFKNSEFPKVWRNRPLQYNVPFSVIMFTESFVHKYSKYIEDGGKTTESELRPFVVNYIFYWMRERGVGHYGFINEIMYFLFSKDLINVYDDDIKFKLIESNFTIIYITNYIIEVLIHFTKFRKDGTLDLRIYLDTVFIETIDIWGFISSYYPFLECFFNNYDILTIGEMKAYNLIKSLFINYLYTPRAEPINTNELINNIRELEDILKKEATIDKLGKKPKQIKQIKQLKKKNNNLTRSNKNKMGSNTTKISFKKKTSKNVKLVKNLLFLSTLKKNKT